MSELVPQIRFAGFDGEWVMDDLGSIAEMYQPETISGRDFTEYGFPVFGANGYIGHYSEANHWEDQVTVSARGAVGIPSYVPAPVWITGNSMVIRVAPSKRDKRFLYYSLQAGRAALQRVSAGGVQQQLTREVLRSVGVSGTSLPEQKRIASMFADLDASIDQHRRKHQQLKQTKASLLERMFPAPGETVPQIRFDGFGDEWVESEVGSLGVFLKGSGYSKADVGSGRTPLFLYGRLYTNYQLAVEKVSTFASPRPNSVVSRGNEVLMPSSGETPDDIAVACALLEPGVLIGGDLNVVRPTSQTDPIFLALSLSHGVAKDALSKRAQGKSVVHLHNSDLRALTIYLPSSSEQRAIGAFFAKLDALIDAEQHRVEKLQQVKASLLKKMFV